MSYPRILHAGETAIVVEFGDSVDAVLNRQVQLLDARITAESPHGFTEAVPTYRSLLVRYDPLMTTYDVLERTIQRLLQDSTIDIALTEPRICIIEVHYGGLHGPDLANVAAHTGMTEQQVVDMHAAADYSVAMLGFAPGFCYLLGLPEQLATPRLATPRLHVPPGSVGIAGTQTGVYALDTPGGWQIIGCTEQMLFAPSRQDPFSLHAGDRVKFVPVKGEG